MKTKKQLTNRILSLVLTFVMVISMLPLSSLTALAADTSGDSVTIDLSTVAQDILLGENHTYSLDGGATYTEYVGNLTFTGTTAYSIIINSYAGIHDIVLDNVSMCNKTRNKGNIMVSENASLNLTLKGTNTLEQTGGNLTNSSPAINFLPGAKLTITEESTGILNAKGGYYCAAIGGTYGFTVEINGGTINAGAYHYGGGIGYGYLSSDSSPTTIIINNAVVNASGKGGYAAIGGGQGSSGGASVNIVITNSTVTAVSAGDVAAIGAGYNDSNTYNIAIKNSVVNAETSGIAAAIGSSNTGTAGDIKIVDSVVTATAGWKAAGIGGGPENNVGNILIQNSTVTATGGKLAAGVGGGYANTVSENDKVTIIGSNVCASGDRTIGAGEEGAGFQICNADGSNVALTKITLQGVSRDVKVTKISTATSYEDVDIMTIGGVLYIWLPDGESPTEIIANGQEYIGTVTDKVGTFVFEHTCNVGENGTPASCGKYAVCGLCNQDFGEMLAHSFDSATGKCSLCGALLVAKVDERYYTDFNDALIAWYGINSTLTLLEDAQYDSEYTLEIPEKSHVLDLNGFTLDLGDKYINHYGNKLTIQGKAGSKIISTADYCLRGSDIYLSGTVQMEGKTASFCVNQYEENAITFTSAPQVSYTVLKEETGLFALPGEGVTLDTGKFTSATAGYMVIRNADGGLEIAGCDHSGSQHTTATDNGDGTHSFTCTVCGATVTEDHTLTYSASGSTITVTCSAECGYTGTATISATGKTYDGTAAEIIVTKTGSLENTDVPVTLTKDGEAFAGEPKDAGDYTASITIGDATASVDFTIAKAVPTYTVPLGLTATYGQTLSEVTLTTPSGGTPGHWTWNDESTTSVGNAGSNKFKATFTPTDKNYKTVEADITIVVAKANPSVTAPTGISGLVYTGEAQALVGAGSTTGGTLQYSLDNATWSAEIPTATNAGDYTVYYKVFGGENYEDVAVQSIIVTITDKTLPAGEILIKNNPWNKFWNTITFGIFCKDYVDVTITADGTGSGVAKVEYLLSETALDENNIPDDGWTTLTKDGDAYKFKILPQNKVAVYVRITDEGGNVTVINSDGIVVYEDSEAVDTEVTYTYKENSNKDIAVKFNGNTVRSIACGEIDIAPAIDYTVDHKSGKIVLQAFYLDTLNAGNYTFTVSYNPMGVKDSGVTDLTTTFSVKVEPTSIADATVTVNGTFTYDGNAKTPDPVVVLNGETLVKDQDYTVSYNNNTNATNDGKATAIVTGKGNYTGSVNGSFEIGRAELTDVSVQQNGKLTYDGGKALTPAVTANATALNGAEVLFMYSADGTTYGSMPTFTDAGTYTVYYQAYTTDNNFIDQYGTFTVTIDKAIVNEPTIASKPFNNAVQKADISDTDLYTVEKNNGGTEKGSYDVVLKLKDSANYKWSTTDSEEVTVQFVISAAQNVWETTPAISGWTYGETAKTPVGAAKYGTVKVVYSGTANDGSAYNSETAPTKAGSYTATFTVEGTEDYSGLSEQVNFTIAKKAVTVTANDASKTYGDSDPTFTYTHTDLVGSDALVITVARASGENANTYTITASQAEGANPNYEITFKAGTFTINKAALTVTVEDKTATYGDAVPNYTVKYDGFKNGDDKDDLGGTLAFDCDYAQFSDKGEYTVKASGYTSGNYTISYVDGKLTVNAKTITVTIQNATSIYGEALAELKATDNGIVNGDTNVYSLATVATSTSNVGKYAITGTALDSNYAITFENGEYEITKREITITVEAKNTIVNTALPTYTYKVEGLVGEDKLETEPTLTSNADITVIGEYDITATGADAGSNYSIKYVPAKLTVLTDNAVDAAAGYTEELKGYEPATVTSEDKAELDEILNEINTILDDENITDNGKKALEEVKEQVEKLIKEITDAADATDTENVGKVENVTPENVTPENKTDLEGAKADLEKALEDHGSNMTEDEKKAVEDEIKRIDDALEVIGNVEAVEELIDKLPDTIKKDDESAIKAADDAYNALTDYEKSLVDTDAKKALNDAKAALAELYKPADNTSPDTGDNGNMFLWIALLFISGGAVITLTVVDRKRRTVSKR